MVDPYDTQNLTPPIPSCPYVAPLMVYFKVMEQLEVSDIYNQGDNILEETVSFMKQILFIHLQSSIKLWIRFNIKSKNVRNGFLSQSLQSRRSSSPSFSLESSMHWPGMDFVLWPPSFLLPPRDITSSGR